MARFTTKMERVANRLRSWGYVVKEEPGWRGRGRNVDDNDPRAHIIHHTAGSIRGGTYASKRFITLGSRIAPLSNFYIARNGEIWLICDGKANHAGKGSWPPDIDSNDDSFGTEIENNGIGEPYAWTWDPAVALGAAVILEVPPIITLMTPGHKEYAANPPGWPGRKVDPSFSMSEYRDAVNRKLHPTLPPVSIDPKEVDLDMAKTHLFVMNLDGKGDGWQDRSIGGDRVQNEDILAVTKTANDPSGTDVSGSGIGYTPGSVGFGKAKDGTYTVVQIEGGKPNSDIAVLVLAEG